LVFPVLARGDEEEEKYGFIKTAEEYEKEIDHKLEIKAIPEEVAKDVKKLIAIYKEADEKKVEAFNKALKEALAKE